PGKTATELVDVDDFGSLGTAGAQRPSMSADGRFVVFDSVSDNLVANDIGQQDVFIRDRCVGPTAPPGCTPSTRRLSDALGGGTANKGSDAPQITADGRYVCVATKASDIAVDLPNGAGIVVRDLVTGAGTSKSPSGSAEAVSADSNGAAAVSA